ncbi:hypothetical protein Goarm_000683, partial [Gossypium armourianum]|nr:hypothetical protein [Gossypium armourianum]
MDRQVAIDMEKAIREVMEIDWRDKDGGHSGGLAMLWKDGVNVTIQNYSSHHIDSLVHMECNTPYPCSLPKQSM